VRSLAISAGSSREAQETTALSHELSDTIFVRKRVVIIISIIIIIIISIIITISNGELDAY
jgi:hypothetical protein